MNGWLRQGVLVGEPAEAPHNAVRLSDLYAHTAEAGKAVLEAVLLFLQRYEHVFVDIDHTADADLRVLLEEQGFVSIGTDSAQYSRLTYPDAAPHLAP